MAYEKADFYVGPDDIFVSIDGKEDEYTQYDAILLDNYSSSMEPTPLTSSVDGAASSIAIQESTDLVQKEKNDSSESEDNPYLIDPLNWTDPIVWHDPTFNKGVIVKSLTMDKDSANETDAQQTAHKIDGIYFPIIKVNKRILDNSEIIKFRLRSETLFPELELVIHDNNGIINSTNSSGINNEINIIIIASVDGLYKKIKLPFYILNVLPMGGGNLMLISKFKLLPFEKLHNEEMNWPACASGPKYEFPGCVTCPQSAAVKPNTWEMLHWIASQTGLGFASTKQCKEIEDRRYRFFKGTFGQVIEQTLPESGLDSDSIFDVWIDLRGYLTMVNFPWILNEDITYQHLSIMGIKGWEQTNENASTQEPIATVLNRTITNSIRTSQTITNLTFKKFEVITDNDLYEKGTLSTYRSMSPKGATGNNTINEYQVQIEENSVDGKHTEDYETSQQYYSGMEMHELNLLERKTLYNSFWSKHRSKMLKIVMDRANLGLSRGMLINVIIVETNPKQKSQILNATSNLVEDNIDDPKSLQVQPATTDEEQPDTAPTVHEIVTNPNVELQNESLSGLYYIDKMEYYFTKETQEIQQTMWLIKKGIWSGYNNKYTSPRIDTTLQKTKFKG